MVFSKTKQLCSEPVFEASIHRHGGATRESWPSWEPRNSSDKRWRGLIWWYRCPTTRNTGKGHDKTNPEPQCQAVSISSAQPMSLDGGLWVSLWRKIVKKNLEGSSKCLSQEKGLHTVVRAERSYSKGEKICLDWAETQKGLREMDLKGTVSHSDACRYQRWDPSEDANIGKN